MSLKIIVTRNQQEFLRIGLFNFCIADVIAVVTEGGYRIAKNRYGPANVIVTSNHANELFTFLNDFVNQNGLTDILTLRDSDTFQSMLTNINWRKKFEMQNFYDDVDWVKEGF